MTTASTYQVGRPIYRASSNAPTRGTVNPMGYIDRNLGMSPVGRDGMSDKRSGLAAAALQRLQQGPQQSQSPQQQPEQPGRPPMQSPDMGYTVSATGQLIPNHPRPLQKTMDNIYGTPSAPMPSEAQLMQAARDRLSHQHSVAEMSAKHHVNMEKLMLHAQHAIHQHRNRMRGSQPNG